MSSELDPALAAAFGSETRLRVLAVLAHAYGPLTGYRVAKTGGVSIPKAHEQLHRLERSGLVAHREDGWVILDRDVRILLRKRIRIRAWDDWLTEKAEKEPRIVALFDRLSRAPHAEAPKGWEPRDPKRFHRDPRKDKILGRMGLPRSLHGQ
ncbi:MAG: helix-turn-helix domain-containing protein [Thermoplasmata archaeon]